MQQLVLRIESKLAPQSQQHVLPMGQRAVLGRGRDATVLILDEQASRHHVSLELTPQGLTVTDLGSANGTFLEEQRLPPNQPQAVAPGATLRIGATTIKLGGPPPVAEEFERLGELGRGAYGAVYHARHRASGQEVAIKSMHAQEGDTASRARFMREARVRIEVPQVVQVYDVRSEGERVYIIMELVRGESLKARIERRGVLPVPEALWIAEEVARALAAAHKQRMVHRDVKPANILLTQEGAVKLADFGIAKERGSALTATGQGMGTLAYLAPEQAEDAKRVSPAADLYALGATLFQMISGRVPFDSKAPDFFERLFTVDAEPLHKLRPDCPPAVSRLVKRLLEKEHDDRFPNARTLIKRLTKLRAEFA